MTLTGDITLSCNNPPAALTQIEFELEIAQDSTGGWLVTFPPEVINPPVINGTADSTSIITLRTNDGGVSYRAIVLLGATPTSGGGQWHN